MRLVYLLALIIISSPVCFGLGVEFSCPEKVYFNQSFECTLKIADSGNYDVKADIFGNGARVSKVWGGGWKSTNYYVNNFSSSKLDLIIFTNFQGEAEGVLRIRKDGGSSIIYTSNFSLLVEKGKNIDEIDTIVLNNSGSSEDTNSINPVVLDNSNKEVVPSNHKNNPNLPEEITNINTPITENSAENESIIKLNSPINYNSVIYESRNEKIKHYAIYAFCLFLILIIALLLLKK